MILGIEASNIIGGGGVSHLKNILKSANPNKYGIKKVIVWANSQVRNKLHKRPWLHLPNIPMIDGNILQRICWQIFILDKYANQKCDILFIPGGTYLGRFSPYVTMSRNLLLFDHKELFRYKFSKEMIRLLFLRYLQSFTFRGSDGVIFLNSNAQKIVEGQIGNISQPTRVIPHGVDDRFRQKPKNQKPITNYSKSKPFRFLYVSKIREYKHQWNVVEAASDLRSKDFPIVVDFLGGHEQRAMMKFREAMERYDPHDKCCFYRGNVSYRSIHRWYHNADALVFASTCENMPNILIEGMAAGLPIVCSYRGSMPEILEDGGLYFDPENVESLKVAMKELITSPNLRNKIAHIAFKRSEKYSWDKCSNETFKFISTLK